MFVKQNMESPILTSPKVQSFMPLFITFYYDITIWVAAKVKADTRRQRHTDVQLCPVLMHATHYFKR